MFTHKPLTRTDLLEHYYDGKRHYLLPSGKAVPSVTTVLSQAIDKPYLAAWRQRVGDEKANRIMTQAQRRGTEVHTIVEHYLNNDLAGKVNKFMPVNYVTFKTLVQHLDNIDTIYGLEIPLYSEKLQTAGRCDILATWGMDNAIIDIKTSKHPKSKDEIMDYFIQTACYAHMADELYNIGIKKLVIIMAVDHDDPLLFVVDRKDYEQQMLDIFIKDREHA